MIPNMEHPAWRPLEGTDPATAAFPLAASFDDEPIWILRTEVGLLGIQEKCPHLDKTLDNARVVAGGRMIRCGHHNYTFRLTDGGCVNFPGHRVALYDVKEQDGKLFVRRREAVLK
jgi:nitrite reductase/ring-hydroxylating ferredoxin subunit